MPIDPALRSPAVFEVNLHEMSNEELLDAFERYLGVKPIIAELCAAELQRRHEADPHFRLK